MNPQGRVALERVRDIEWLESLDAALAAARQRGRMIVVKPAGQGIGVKDDW
jgi:hypothetical protein